MTGEDELGEQSRSAFKVDEHVQTLIFQMRQRLNELHGVNVQAHDPLIMAMSGLVLALEQGLSVCKAGQDEVLSAHRSELEVMTLRWQRDADAIGLRIVSKVLKAVEEETGYVAQQACDNVAVRIEEALVAHEKQLQSWLWWSGSLVTLVAIAIIGVVVSS